MKTSVKNIWILLLTMKANSLRVSMLERAGKGCIYKQLQYLNGKKKCPSTTTSCFKPFQDGEALSSVLYLSHKGDGYTRKSSSGLKLA